MCSIMSIEHVKIPAQWPVPDAWNLLSLKLKNQIKRIYTHHTLYEKIFYNI